MYKFSDLKKLITKKTEGNNKKNIENMVVFVILLIITIFAINTIWGKNGKSNVSKDNTNLIYKSLAETQNNNLSTASNISNLNEYNLKEQLEDILSEISGVGKVKVLITYSETSEIVAMYNEKYTSSSTEETDSGGGARTVKEASTDKEIIFEDDNGENVPVTQKVLMPKIEGAIITSEGGGNAEIKTNIIQAVAAVTGLATYRVQVFEMAK